MRAFALVALSLTGSVVASPQGDPWRLGVFFWHPSPNDQLALQGIKDGLEIWGHPFELVVRQAESDEDRADVLLDDLAARDLDLVFAMGTQATLLAGDRFGKVPVVFTAVTNPVESKVVPSWEEGSGRPLAGNSNWISSETTMHVFRAAVPTLGRLGVLRSQRSGVVSVAEIASMQRYLADPDAPPVTLVEQVIEEPGDIPRAVERLAADHVDAIWIPIDFVVYEHTVAVLAAAAPFRIPLLASSLRGTRTGAVAGLHVDYTLLGKRAAAMAVDILENGADPATMPVGTMRSYRTVVNLAAARRSGYEPPLPLLVLADVVLDELDLGDDK